MSYQLTVTPDRPGALSDLALGETETAAAILRNVAVILATRKGSVPLYRDFGISWDALDKPLPVAQTMLIPEIREAIETWEPRASFLGVTFAQDLSMPGTLIPTVEVEINDS